MKDSYYFILLNSFILLQIIASVIYAGSFAYPLDDPYIHLAVADNLTGNGIWGAVWGEFSGTSSSLLFTLLNSILFIILPDVLSLYFPIILNIIAANLFLYSLFRISKYWGLSDAYKLMLFLFIIVFIPLVANVINGMEHIWQVLFTLLYTNELLKILKDKGADLKYFLILAVLNSSIRFEGLFLVIAASIILVIQRKSMLSFYNLLIGFLPVIIFGLISLSNNAYFFPNTIMAKGSFYSFDLDSLIKLSYHWIETIIDKKQIITPFLLVLFSIYYWIIKKHRSNILLSVFTLLVFIAHLSFADLGWFFRYESYLIFLSVFIIIFVINDIFKSKSKNYKKIIAVILLIISLPMIYRFGVSVYRSTTGTALINDLQVNYAKFTEKYFENDLTIAAGDIGTLCYYTKNPIVDLNGLATLEMTKAIKEGRQTSEFIDSLTKVNDCKFAVIYSDWEGELIPDNWKPAGYWAAYNPTGGSYFKFGFYSIDSNYHSKLVQNLKDFSPNLPDRVKESGYYIER